MTEQPDTPKILDEISRSNSAASTAGSTRKKQNARRRFLIFLMLFVPILAGLLVLGYQQYLLWNELTSLTAENQQLRDTLTEQNSQLNRFREQLAQPPQPVPVDDSSVRAVEASLNAEIETLRQQLSGLRNQQSRETVEPDFQWKVMEAEYLLGIANRKLQLEADPPSAIVLVEEADAALVASGSNNLFAVRQAIAGELAQLRDIEMVDRDGIYLSIANLIDQVDDIDLPGSMRQNFENRRGAGSAPVEVGAGNQGFVDSMFEFLSSVFVWREWEETPAAMLAPGQENYLKQSLRLMLEQARFALLDRDKELFRRSLGNSTNWLQRYSVTDSPLGQTMLTELNGLVTIDIDPPLPNVNQSLDLIGRITGRD